MGVILRKRSYCHEFYVIIKDSEKLQRLSLQHYFSLKINWKLKCVKIKDILILLRVKDYRECMPYPHNIIKITKKSSQKFEGRKKKNSGKCHLFNTGTTERINRVKITSRRSTN